MYPFALLTSPNDYVVRTAATSLRLLGRLLPNQTGGFTVSGLLVVCNLTDVGAITVATEKNKTLSCRSEAAEHYILVLEMFWRSNYVILCLYIVEAVIRTALADYE